MQEINFKIKNFKSIKEETNINLKSGKINVLIGPNGSGKSNFLDAIFYFVNNNDKDEKTDTETTSFCKLDTTEILNKSVNYNEILKIDEVKKIDSILKEFNIKSNFLPKQINKNFTSTKNSFFGNLYLDEFENETILTSIIGKILEVKRELLGEKFIHENNKNNLLLKPKTEIDKFLNSPNLHQKEVIKNIIEKIYLIEDIFKKRPTVTYIKNAEIENKTEFIYNLDSILKHQNSLQPQDRELLGMLTFLGGTDGYNTIFQICNLSDTPDDLKCQMKLKQNFKEKATNKINKLFKDFDIYAFPEVEIDAKRLIIKVKDRNNYWYNASETGMNSSGYKSFFEILFKLESCKFIAEIDNSKICIVLADEPDKNLHPILQYQLADFIRKTLAKYPNIFLVYTTHSPFLIDPKLDNINIVTRSEKGSSYLINTNNSKQINGTIGWYTLEIAKVLSNLNENHPIKILRNKLNVHYEGNENDDLMLLKEKLGYQAHQRYNLISLSNINKEEKDKFSIIKSLTKIADLDDIDYALSKNQRVLILRQAYDNE